MYMYYFRPFVRVVLNLLLNPLLHVLPHQQKEGYEKEIVHGFIPPITFTCYIYIHIQILLIDRNKHIHAMTHS